MPTIDPSFLTAGPEFSLGPVDGPEFAIDESGLGTAPAPGAEGFGSVLGRQLEQLSELQTQAADAGASLAAGTATDPGEVVMAVERARLSMQLASQLRTKGVEAVNEVFRTQV